MSVERKASVLGAVLGNYRVTGALGTGGMGSVWRARNQTSGEDVAVKVLRSELTADPEQVNRFFNEARAAARIQHPGIIQVFDAGYATDGRAYLVMELLLGLSLRDRLDKRGKLHEGEAIELARRIAEALAAAHKNNIIHRDLKPENIFLIDGDRPKLLDFGIAKLTDRNADEASRTRTGSLIGTPVYMAPEQAQSAGSIDHRADLYSLGCIMYELVTGQPPFTNMGIGELLAAHMFTEPERPSRRAPISARLDTLIMRLLAKEPRDRPRDANEVVLALGGDAVPVHSWTGMPIVVLEHGVANAASSMPEMLARNFDDAPPVSEPSRSHVMPIVAAVATIAIAAGALWFVLGRGGGDDDPPAKRDEVKETVPPAHPTPSPGPGPQPKHVVETPKPPKPDPKPDPKPVEPKPVDPKPDPKPVGPKRVVVHHDPGPTTPGPVTNPGPGPVTSPSPDPSTNPVTAPVASPPPGPLVTPKGAPLNGGLGSDTGSDK